MLRSCRATQNFIGHYHANFFLHLEVFHDLKLQKVNWWKHFEKNILEVRDKMTEGIIHFPKN